MRGRKGYAFEVWLACEIVCVCARACVCVFMCLCISCARMCVCVCVCMYVFMCLCLCAKCVNVFNSSQTLQREVPAVVGERDTDRLRQRQTQIVCMCDVCVYNQSQIQTLRREVSAAPGEDLVGIRGSCLRALSRGMLHARV